MLISIREQNFSQDVFNASTPVLVHFWAPWCGLCKMITPLLVKFQTQWGDRIQVVGINADESLKLSSTYRLTNLPTLILFDGTQILQRWEGFHGRESLRLALEEIAQRYDQESQVSVR